MIRLQEVNHIYAQGSPAAFQSLTEITMEIPRGSLAVVLGRSGSGKSTLLNLIAGLDRPTSGSIIVGDQNISAMSEDRMTRWRGENIGVVFQFFQLLPTLTVRENLLLAMEFVRSIPADQREQQAENLLALVGIEAQSHKLPSMLSGGQQQRAAVARALVNNPKVVVADEPTGNLDSSSADAVLGLFEELRQRGDTLVLVTHDPRVAERGDVVVEITDGRIAVSSSSRKEEVSS